MKKNILIISLSFMFVCCSNRSKPSTYDFDLNSTDNSTVITSKGYSSDSDYKPTVDDNGDYHTIDGGSRQIQYQGSQEQQRDLDLIDEYMRNNPDF